MLTYVYVNICLQCFSSTSTCAIQCHARDWLCRSILRRHVWICSPGVKLASLMLAALHNVFLNKHFLIFLAFCFWLWDIHASNRLAWSVNLTELYPKINLRQISAKWKEANESLFDPVWHQRIMNIWPASFHSFLAAVESGGIWTFFVSANPPHHFQIKGNLVHRKRGTWPHTWEFTNWFPASTVSFCFLETVELLGLLTGDPLPVDVHLV